VFTAVQGGFKRIQALKHNMFFEEHAMDACHRTSSSLRADGCAWLRNACMDTQNVRHTLAIGEGDNGEKDREREKERETEEKRDRKRERKKGA
jgi:hypothetical protein